MFADKTAALNLNFRGTAETIASYLILHPAKNMLVECDPGSTIPALVAGNRPSGSPEIQVQSSSFIGKHDILFVPLIQTPPPSPPTAYILETLSIKPSAKYTSSIDIRIFTI